jgi:hypothetical protein
MDETPIRICAFHVDIRAHGQVVRMARADFEIDGIPIRPVYKMVSVTGVFGKCRALARSQNGLPVVLYEDEHSFQHEYELARVAVPVSLTGPIAWWQSGQIDSEVGQPAGIAKSASLSLAGQDVEFGRIRGSLAHWYA